MGEKIAEFDADFEYFDKVFSMDLNSALTLAFMIMISNFGKKYFFAYIATFY
jgi:hypothetical protein